MTAKERQMSLKEYRRRSNLRVSEIAERVGISRWAYYEIEKGDVEYPQAGTVDGLCEVFGVDSETLHDLIEETKRRKERKEKRKS